MLHIKQTIYKTEIPSFVQSHDSNAYSLNNVRRRSIDVCMIMAVNSA